MMNGASVTVVGNLGSDPVTRETSGGKTAASLSVAVTRRVRNGDGAWHDGNVTWFRVIAWGALAHNVAASLTKGARVIVTGTLTQNSYEADGQARTVLEITADAIGCDLATATAVITKRNAADSAPLPAEPQ